MNYPFGTITIIDKTKRLILEALDSKNLSMDKYVRELEEKFAERVGVKEAIAVSSGTDADTIALVALYDKGVERGSEVIVPALSYFATSASVIHAGFKPVFIDIDRNTLNINPFKIEEKLSKKTCAILPVHNMGKPADMNYITDLAKKHHIFVVEDAAEAHGARYYGRNAGTLADIGAFSLNVAHIISSIEGGMITTNDSDLANAARSLRAHGRNCSCKSCISRRNNIKCEKRFQNGVDQRFLFGRIGYSSKMNELEAAVGLGSMEIYENILNKRRENLLYLLDNFKQFSKYLRTFKEEPHEIIGPHAFPVIVNEDAPFSRNSYTIFLQEKGVDTRDLFSCIPTQYSALKFLGYKLGDFPDAEFIGKNGMHIGVHQEINKEHMDHFLEKTGEFIKKY